MKRTLLCVLAAVIAVLCASANALVPEDVDFSHPEVGEVIQFRIVNGAPYFAIYGYVYYDIVDPASPYRGLYANRFELNAADMPDLETVLTNILGDTALQEGTPGALSYGGGLEAYAGQLSALQGEELRKAVGILGGFIGEEGFSSLGAAEGFEEADTRALAEGYTAYTVRVDGHRTPYRVLSFRSWDEEGEPFIERYCFLRLDDQWRLSRLSREYTDDYQSRTAYIHGVPGSDPTGLEAMNEEALDDVAWGSSPDEVSGRTGVPLREGKVTVEDYILYRLPTTLEYLFEEGALTQRRFLLEEEEAYYAAFVSLYTRYSDPITLSETGEATWSTEDLFIVLHPGGSDNPSIDFYPF